MKTFKKIQMFLSLYKSLNRLAKTGDAMSKTKIAGVLLIIVAVANTALDAINGGGFDFQQNVANLMAALGGAGFVFLRQAIEKLDNIFKRIKE